MMRRCNWTCLCWWINPHYKWGTWYALGPALFLRRSDDKRADESPRCGHAIYRYDFGSGFGVNAIVNAFIGDAFLNSFLIRQVVIKLHPHSFSPHLDPFMITRHFVRLGSGSIGSSSPRRSRHSTSWTRQSACAIRTICRGASSTSSRHTAHQSIHSNPHPNQSHDPFIVIHNFIIH